MHRIAHVSDVHLLDPNTKRAAARYRFATKFVSLGRPIDPRARAKKLARSLAAAKASGADHVVISGDLTELGDPHEVEYFGEVLAESRWSPDAVTLVPGNHDAYTIDDAWARAMGGPLACWSSSSAAPRNGVRVVDRGNVAFVPLDTSCFQSIALSGGELTKEAVAAVDATIRDPGLRDKAVVLVMHHPPFAKNKNPVWQWIDALRGGTHVLDLLVRHPRVQLLHGHMHRIVDRLVGTVKSARVFGAPAVCDDTDGARVRLYDVRDASLESAGLFAT